VPAALERLLFEGLLVKSRQLRLSSMAEVLTLLDTLITTTGAIPRALTTFDDAGAEPRAPPPAWLTDEPPPLGPPPWEVDVWP
jgi:hypothetical protein